MFNYPRTEQIDNLFCWTGTCWKMATSRFQKSAL